MLQLEVRKRSTVGGTIAGYCLKLGMEAKLQMFEAEIRAAKIPGLLAEFAYLTDEDPTTLKISGWQYDGKYRIESRSQATQIRWVTDQRQTKRQGIVHREPLAYHSLPFALSNRRSQSWVHQRF